MSNEKKLSSEQLAVLIIDTLIDSGIVQSSSFEAAVRIATEEIDARKAVQDY